MGVFCCSCYFLCLGQRIKNREARVVAAKVTEGRQIEAKAGSQGNWIKAYFSISLWTADVLDCFPLQLTNLPVYSLLLVLLHPPMPTWTICPCFSPLFKNQLILLLSSLTWSMTNKINQNLVSISDLVSYPMQSKN